VAGDRSIEQHLNAALEAAIAARGASICMRNGHRSTTRLDADARIGAVRSSSQRPGANTIRLSRNDIVAPAHVALQEIGDGREGGLD